MNEGLSIGPDAMIGFKKASGERLTISARPASESFLSFARHLEEGQEYVFPRVILEYEDQHGVRLDQAASVDTAE